MKLLAISLSMHATNHHMTLSNWSIFRQCGYFHILINGIIGMSRIKIFASAPGNIHVESPKSQDIKPFMPY